VVVVVEESHEAVLPLVPGDPPDEEKFARDDWRTVASSAVSTGAAATSDSSTIGYTCIRGCARLVCRANSETL
jgi:flavin reductase (DIM6/NTAB) family NADH-FMN oxidoreductase RutF